MEMFDYNEPGRVYGMENESVPSQPGMDVGEGIPAEPGFGPIGPVTPSLPSDNDVGEGIPAEPGFGPIGPVTPSLPSGGTSSQPSIGQPTPSRPSFGRPQTGGGFCNNCSYIGWPTGSTAILWTWGTLSPYFSTSSEIAHLRFYNAAAIREPLDIYLNGRMVVSDLDYMNYTRFLHIIPGTYRLTVYSRTNLGPAIIDTNIRVNSGTSNTLVILGTVGNYSIQMITS